MELKVTATKLDIQNVIGNPADEIATSIVDIFREETDKSNPRGRLYRRGAMTTRRTKKLESLGLARRWKTRLVSGAKLHRASAEGQFPAKDSGRLYRDIQIVKKGANRQVRFNAPYSGEIEEIRPFTSVVSELAVQRFLDAG